MPTSTVAQICTADIRPGGGGYNLRFTPTADPDDVAAFTIWGNVDDIPVLGYHPDPEDGFNWVILYYESRFVYGAIITNKLILDNCPPPPHPPQPSFTPTLTPSQTPIPVCVTPDPQNPQHLSPPCDGGGLPVTFVGTDITPSPALNGTQYNALDDLSTDNALLMWKAYASHQATQDPTQWIIQYRSGSPVSARIYPDDVPDEFYRDGNFWVAQVTDRNALSPADQAIYDQFLIWARNFIRSRVSWNSCLFASALNAINASGLVTADIELMIYNSTINNTQIYAPTQTSGQTHQKY
jgi:hypothetical protein